jgi:outer membrane usher protein FimD/PapC
VVEPLPNKCKALSSSLSTEKKKKKGKEKAEKKLQLSFLIPLKFWNLYSLKYKLYMNNYKYLHVFWSIINKSHQNSMMC